MMEEMIKKKSEKVLNLSPFQFDEHFFIPSWRPTVYGFYSRFHIERVERYKTHLSLPLAPHRRSVYVFFYLKTGLAIRTKGLSRYEIKAGQFFFLPSQQITSVECISEDATGFYCHFQPEIFLKHPLKVEIDKEFPFFQLRTEPVVTVNEFERIEQLMDILEQEYCLSLPERFDLVPLYLTALLSEVKHLTLTSEQANQSASSNITQRYKNALSEFIYKKKTVAEFAEYLAISPNHLHKCVKATTGKTAHDLLNEMRILEAKVLLKQTNLSVGEIAFKIGQLESSDFSRLFKKSTTYTPNQYRRISMD